MNVNIIGAGLKNAYVKTADGNSYDVFAVVSAEADPQQDEIEIKGDDETKATFVTNQREEITIQANGLNIETVQAITGNSLTSSASGMEIPLGTEGQANPVNLEVGAETTAQDADKVSVTVRKVWHNVEIKSLKLSQAGEQEFNVEMSGMAYQTSTNITGGALASKRVATLYIDY
jgi:hypothetical protein